MEPENVTYIKGYEHFIQEHGQTSMVDYAYAKKGQEEGWLIFVHGFRDYRDIYVSTYILVEPGVI